MKRIIDRLNGRLLFGVCVGAAISLVATIIVAWASSQNQINQNADEINQTKTALAALCLQRRDLDQRIKHQQKSILLTRQILDDHKGRYVFGIPRNLLVKSFGEKKLEQKQSIQTRKNLSILDCKGGKS